MATYICLGDWTQQGIENIQDSPGRLDDAKKAVEAAGGAVRDFYMTTGEHDMVLVVEVPDDIALAKVLLRLGSKGSVRSTTMRAFTESEYREIVGSV